MDISKIKYIIDFSKKTRIHYALEQEDIEILDHILAEREEDKKKIEELEKKNRIYALEGSKIALELHIKDNYIPKQKVLEEIDQLLEAFRKVEFNRVTTWNSLVLLKERLLGGNK